MNWLDRLRGKRDLAEEGEKREQRELKRRLAVQAKRAGQLEEGLRAEIRRLEGAPWKR